MKAALRTECKKLLAKQLRAKAKEHGVPVTKDGKDIVKHELIEALNPPHISLLSVHPTTFVESYSDSS